jgi:hypothetical protein
MKTITKNLDFSGGKNSWFDFWHTHIDWDGEGNKSWNVRKEFLEKLLTEFGNVKSELKKYPNEYQTWILIDENDSGQDAIYIHTKNPNSENFPLKVQMEKNIQCLNQNLWDFMKKTDLEILEFAHENGNYFFLTDKNFGISLTN